MLEMTLEIADRAARSALDKAAALKVAMTVTVVDEAGRVVVVMKGDRAGFLTTDTSGESRGRRRFQTQHPRSGRIAENQSGVLVGGARGIERRSIAVHRSGADRHR
jgi:uncharacterized protein GlcG (DUF336 family)